MTATGDKVFVIAEAGVNHNGDAAAALEMVDAAADAGADAVKFQTFRPELLSTADAPKARYQEAGTGGGGQRDMLSALALDEDDHRRLKAKAAERGIAFLSTPFDLPSLAFLVDSLDLPLIKLGSGSVINGPLLLAAARTGRRIVLSTGMSTLEEIADAVSLLAFGYVESAGTPGPDAVAAARASDAGARALRERLTLLHCSTSYPVAPDEVNLRAMDTLADRFGLPVGYSDHTQGGAVAVAAVARGATIIEKHFTLDRGQTGPDHAASLEPDALARMIADIREVAAALGSAEKTPTKSERENIRAARPSLVAIRPIAAGETFTCDNLGAKRPGSGLSPMRYWEWLGRAAGRAYREDELIEP